MAGSVDGIIRRKVAAARAESLAGGPGADRGWRLALARAARDKLNTVLDISSLSLVRRSLGEVIEAAPERAMIAILDGPSEGLGVLMLSQPILAGMIEAQTMGRVKTTEITPRRPTRTDASMVAGVIDAALRGLEQALADEADLVWAGGFRYASYLDEPRPLGLLLEDTTYRLLRAEVDLGGGARRGDILLALPAEGRGQAPTLKADHSASPDHSHQFLQALTERVNGAPSGMEAVLTRLRLPIAEVMALEVGMVLALPDAALDQISLEGLDGRRVAEGRLGQNRGMRAIRLSEGSASDTSEASVHDAMAMAASEFPAADFAMSDLPDPGFGDFGAAEGMEMDFAATGTE